MYGTSLMYELYILHEPSVLPKPLLQEWQFCTVVNFVRFSLFKEASNYKLLYKNALKIQENKIVSCKSDSLYIFDNSYKTDFLQKWITVQICLRAKLTTRTNVILRAEVTVRAFMTPTRYIQYKTKAFVKN